LGLGFVETGVRQYGLDYAAKRRARLACKRAAVINRLLASTAAPTSRLEAF